jgi:ppGpp synthetase/RelA/SpoT-type nucleotidyltranferase
MKIPASIRSLYDDQYESRKLLKDRVDALVRPRLHDRWHYESRVKTEESFTLKIESGRVADLASLEDFFAATVVVRNGLEIAEAEKLITELFPLHSRRPEKDDETRKAPNEFPFDDLRLYVRWSDNPALPTTGFHGVRFEIQVKTFLQHAWSIATHDLTYKSDDVSWGTMRIAFQIKAMLEHAEISIQEATRLAESEALKKSDDSTSEIKAFIRLINDLWDKEDLPANIRGLAENVMRLAKKLQLDVNVLRSILLEEKSEGRGPLTRNLTPYGVVLQSLFNRRKDALFVALKKRQKQAVIITKELELPPDSNLDEWKESTLLVGL